MDQVYPAKQFCKTGLDHACNLLLWWPLLLLVTVHCSDYLAHLSIVPCSTKNSYTFTILTDLPIHLPIILRFHFLFIILSINKLFIVGFKLQQCLQACIASTGLSLHSSEWMTLYRSATEFEYFTGLLPVYYTGLYTIQHRHVVHNRADYWPVNILKLQIPCLLQD